MKWSWLAWGLPVAALAWGCGSDGDGPKKSDENPAPASGGAGPASGGGGGATSTPSGGQGSGGTQQQVTPNVYLPLIVDEHYFPSGFMGREEPGGPHEVDGIVMDLDECPERAPGAAGAAGECHRITYTPQAIDANAGSTWAGVFWQFPESNWGEVQGEAIEQGATKVVFTAWSAEDGQQVEFLAGGIGDPGSPFRDSFKVQQTFTLSTTPQSFEMSLATSSYVYVLGAFGWVISTSSDDPIVFYVDDIRWVK